MIYELRCLIMENRRKLHMAFIVDNVLHTFANMPLKIQLVFKSEVHNVNVRSKAIDCNLVLLKMR